MLRDFNNNNNDQPMQTVQVKDCVIKLRKLSASDIDFLSGQRLLPSLNEPDIYVPRTNTFMDTNMEDQHASVPYSKEHETEITVTVNRKSSDSVITTNQSKGDAVSAPQYQGEVAGQLNNRTTEAHKNPECDARPSKIHATTDLISAPKISKHLGEVAGQGNGLRPMSPLTDIPVSAPQTSTGERK